MSSGGAISVNGKGGMSASHLAPPEPSSLPPAAVLPMTVIICTWQRPESVRQLLLNLAEQQPPPAQILIVEGHETQRGDCEDPECRICSVLVPGTPWVRRHHYTLPNLEHQRNVGADLVDSAILCFLDDDVMLEPGCLAAIAAAFAQDPEGKVGGVGGFEIDNPLAGRVPWRWRVRRALGVVPSLTPGRYTRSGNSIPLELSPPFTGCRPVDFLTGYCMAFRHHVLQEIRFVPDVGTGEDLHYSLRVAHRYRLLHCGDARLRHLREPVARASHRRYAFMSLYNRYRYQRDCLLDRHPRDVCLLWYGVAVDLAMLFGQWVKGGNRRAAADHIIGRLRAIFVLATRGADTVAIEAARRAFPRRSTKEY
jgi:GT2 family glycosyltransferase